MTLYINIYIYNIRFIVFFFLFLLNSQLPFPFTFILVFIFYFRRFHFVFVYLFCPFFILCVCMYICLQFKFHVITLLFISSEKLQIKHGGWTSVTYQAATHHSTSILPPTNEKWCFNGTGKETATSLSFIHAYIHTYTEISSSISLHMIK